MKYSSIIISMLMLAGIQMSCTGKQQKADENASDATENVTDKGFACGADVSWLTQMESEGRKFYTPGDDRQEMECMQLLRDHCGVDAIRLRVWVNPEDGWNGIEDVVKKAVRADSLGMRTMIDFHFSDTWADPGHQVMPEAWKDLSFDELKKALADHVTETLTAIKDAGVTPEWVQIGNETTPGMMLPAGSLEENPQQLAELTTAGHKAAKSVFPQIKTIVHLDCGNDMERYDKMFDVLKEYGAEYDMIGMSIYYYWALAGGYDKDLNTFIKECDANIKHVKEKYGKPVMICEIGDAYDEPERTRETIAAIMKCDVEGVFYWEPEAPGGFNGGYNLGCFDNDAPTVALDAFKDK